MSEKPDVGEAFRRTVQTLFSQLTKRGLGPNWAASQALSLATDKVESLVDLPVLLEELKKTAEPDAESHPAAKLLEDVFLQPDIFVASFGKAKPPFTPGCGALHEQSGDHSASSKGKDGAKQEYLELDMEQVDQLYSAIAASEDEQLQADFRDIFADFIGDLRDTDREYTWQLISAALQNPLLDEPEHSWLFGEFIEEIRHWDGAEEEEAFITMLASYLQERFLATLQRLQQYITLLVLEEGRVNMAMESAVELMDLFHVANQRAKHVPLAAFYNDAVNEEDFLQSIMVRDLQIWEGAMPFPDHAVSLIRYPFIYDPASKARLLGASNERSQWEEFQSAFLESLTTGGGMPYLLLRVRRGQHLVHDTLLQIQNAGLNVRKPLKVQFHGEEGVDEGGVQKELFHLLMRELFDTDFGMFSMDPVSRTYYFRASGLDMGMEFELVGLLISLAIYNGHILEVSLPMAIYKLLMDGELGLEDLKDVHPEVHDSLQKLLVYDGNVEDLGLFFQVEREGDFGEGTVSVDLIEDGGALAVSDANREVYVTLYVEHLLLKSVDKQRKAFCAGFHKMWRDNKLLLQLFEPEELEALVCGGTDLDFSALQRAAKYEDAFDANSQVIAWFWEVVHGFSEAQKKRLLMFVTGSDRVPIKGLASLQPPLSISRNGCHSDRLPTAHTCFNHLLLPAYKDKASLQNRLELAINNAEGFGLR